MKTSNQRLLDLLAGWDSFCQDEANDKANTLSTEEMTEWDKENDPISVLYQLAGREDMTDEQIKAFLIEEVLPVLCQGGNDETQDQSNGH